MLGKEWTFEISPQQLKMCSVKGLHRPQYFIEKCGVKNMVNLSFFTATTFIPPYKDLETSNLKNPKKWPFLTIENDGFPFIYDGKELNNDNFNIVRNETKFIASGYPILIREGYSVKIKKSFFSRRRCARTAVGIHSNGSMIIYVTTAATLKQVQQYLISLGCIDAINFDGGSSTFLYLNGKKVYSSNEGRSYPNVLYWE
jgi:exopolysaccharide biosynthesis protein